MLLQTAARIAVTVILLLVLVHPCHAAEQKLGLVTQVEGEGFFLNPLVTKILVTEVANGSLAEAAGDQIIQIGGETIAGKRALEPRRFMKLNGSIGRANFRAARTARLALTHKSRALILAFSLAGRRKSASR